MTLVKVNLYAEAQCPDCINYSQTQLSTLMSLVPSIVSLQVFPFGNAKETLNEDGTYSFTCQHGENECTSNMYEACAIHLNPDQLDWYPFFDCVESSPYLLNRTGTYNTTAVTNCASDAFLNWTEIESCAVSPAGNSLMHSIAEATPSHTYVPWVTVNDLTVPDGGDGYPAGDLLTMVCAEYTGTPLPDACPTPTDSKVVGYLAAAVAILGFGTNFVPIKKYDAKDGFYFQLFMCVGIFIVGVVINAIRGFPTFQPLAMLGGFLWCCGNVMTVTCIKLIGLSLGLLIWGSTNSE